MKQLPLVVLLGLVLLTLFMMSAPVAPLPSGATPVETKHAFELFRTRDEIDGMVTIQDRAGAPLGQYYLSGSQLYQDPGLEQPAKLTLTRVRYLIDPALDLGAFAAGSAIQGQDRFQAGLRVSPVRLGYGLVAIDAVVSQDQVGLGASVYPPPDYFGPAWRHIGVGAWYCLPFDQDLEPGLALGISFSTRN